MAKPHLNLHVEHHQVNGHEFEQTLEDSGEQWSLVCCCPWGCRVRHNLVTEQQQQLEHGVRTTAPSHICDLGHYLNIITEHNNK